MPENESRTITAQVPAEFYDKFQEFCFVNDFSKSEVIRESLEHVMRVHAFLLKKNKPSNGKAQ